MSTVRRLCHRFSLRTWNTGQTNSSSSEASAAAISWGTGNAQSEYRSRICERRHEQRDAWKESGSPRARPASWEFSIPLDLGAVLRASST